MALRRVFTYVSAILIFSVPLATAQTVERRARLGNNIEDITFISSGPLADSLVISNGYDIFTVPLHPRGGPKSSAPQTKLADVRSTPMRDAPRGIAFLPDERLLAMHASEDATLYLLDESGAYRGSRPMHFAGAQPTYVEGMDVLPKSSPMYPGDLVFAVDTWDDGNLPPAIVFAKADGTIDAEVTMQPANGFDPSNGVLGIAYQAPGRLLVSLSDGTGSIWAVDFSGNAIGNAPLYAEAGIDSFEGIVQLNNGKVVASNYYTGQLLFFDRDMGRLPSEDRVYSVGIGVSGPFGLAWNSDTGRFLSLSRGNGQLASIAPSLDAAGTVSVDQSSTAGRRLGRIGYVPDVQQFVMLSRTQLNTYINFFNASTGAAVVSSRITIPNATLCTTAQSLEYIPGATTADDLFAIGCANKVALISRATHEIVRQFAKPAGFGTVFQVAYDPANGGRLLLSDDDNVVLVDMFGNPLAGGFNIRAGLNLLLGRDMAVVTSGPDAGVIAMTDADNSEIVVFRIP